MGNNPLTRLARRREATPVRPAAGTRTAQTPRYGVVPSKRRRRPRRSPSQELPFLPRVINAWWNRLISAVFGGGTSQQTEQYLAHQTGRDYLFNTLGQAAWGSMFPLLTMVATWLVGAGGAGQFSMAFTVGTLLLFLANFGVRTYQVSDLDEMRSFRDYQAHRLITCALMLGAALLWCLARGYDAHMLAVCMGVVGFRAVDGLADVYEGRLQQKDKLYLAGLSQAARCVLGSVAFLAVLAMTRDLAAACVALAMGAVVSLLLLSVPLALFETERSLPLSARGVRELFVECTPLFLALFLNNLISSVPMFAMEGALAYDNQLYYNAMYFSGNLIIMVAGFVYKPQLVRLARIWEDREKHRRFDLLVLAMIGVIALVTGGMALYTATIGIPLMSFMYGVDFEPYRALALVMAGTGGVAACIDFLYQIVTVLRAQGQVARLYLIAFAFSVPVCWMLVSFSGLAGAVMGGLVSLAILLVLLVMDYWTIRKRAEKDF